jgi:peptidoglycan/xylan/chitin deacetylase (PgdA/CDA1 family)
VKPSAYGPFPYVPAPKRPKITWPNGARVAFWVVVNFEYFPLDQPIPGGNGKVPDVVAWSRRDYGNRVGAFRIMERMSRFGVRGTANLNADLCAAHPEIVAEAKRLGWEFMAHGRSNSRAMHHLPPERERDEIREALEIITKATGTRPKGWMGPGMHETWNTLDYLADEGMIYNADWINDDQPYLMTVKGKPMVQIPYGEQPHDKGAMDRLHYTNDEFVQMVKDHFDTLYAEGENSGKVVVVALHPFVAGQSYRIQIVDRILDYIMGHPKVWQATGGEIAEHFLKGPTF